MNIIKVKNLTKKYNKFTAVDGIDFDIEKGKIFGFLGPNGAGKTTTINMLTGIVRVSSGSVTIAGIDGVNNVKKVQKLIGVVPDESNLYMDFDGFENLCFCASLYGIRKKERERRARTLLKQFGLESAGKRPFKAYSKGMKRKLTIAAGIIHKPEILFLDEPTTGIDVESARQIRDMISQLKLDGTTIFLTTHYIEEAERLCDRIAFIVNGKIVKTGSVKQLMDSIQDKHIVQISFNRDVSNTIDEFKSHFKESDLEIKKNKIVLYSKDSISLMPLLDFFDRKGFEVYEAKIIKPSLEEVFVKITGIGTSKMEMEKAGGKK